MKDDSAEPIISARTYASFRSRLKRSNCKRCGLWKGRANIVVDHGRPDTGIVVVGEGPGADEDARGAAFVGRAGKLLDELFCEIGLCTDRDLLIANIVKCRPPANRAPTREEAQTCLPYLMRQVELVSPKIVVLLGATSVKHLAPEQSRTALRKTVGKVFDLSWRPGTRGMILYHPAYLLRDPRKRKPTRSHLRKLRRFIDEHGAVSPETTDRRRQT